jgi:hypothetical protein
VLRFYEFIEQIASLDQLEIDLVRSGNCPLPGADLVFVLLSLRLALTPVPSGRQVPGDYKGQSPKIRPVARNTLYGAGHGAQQWVNAAYVLGLPSLFRTIWRSHVPLDPTVRIAGADSPRSSGNSVLEELVREFLEGAALLPLPGAEGIEGQRSSLRHSTLPGNVPEAVCSNPLGSAWLLPVASAFFIDLERPPGSG